MKRGCVLCDYDGEINMWGCPKCKDTGNTMWMEDVRSLTVDVDKLIEDKLKEFEITLTGEQEDEIHEAVWKVLEGVSNGDYRNHN